ncbi:MAG TPA: glycosyltransferase family 2 protein [Anaerolineae bacterium]|nr:glycosyltransferase family 2 protein [Anaerolineae bacterium]
MSTKCSIVIRAYNEANHIGKLLDGICHQSLKDVQVILVDSGSRDRTVEIALSYEVEIIKISPEDFTFGRSLNLGISRAKAPFVVIASAHVFPVYPDWLKKMLEPFRDEKIAMVYGKQRGADTSQFSEKQIFNQWYPDHSQHYQNHPFCNNANSAVRRDLWKQHPFDENLPALEDLAWAKWVFERGLKINYNAEAEIIHVHNETWHGINNRYRREGMAFKQIYPQEKFGLGEFSRLIISNVCGDWCEAKKQGILKKHFFDIIRFRWCQFWGTFQGYRQSGPLTWQLKRSFYYPRNGQKTLNDNHSRDIEPISYDNV